MHETECDDEGMQEEEDEEENAPSTLVNHPVVVLLHGRLGHIGLDGRGSVCGGALEPLEAAALSLVALEVARTGAIDDDVGVRLKGGNLAV